MNPHYILIGMVVLVLFISMGKNPLEPPEGWTPPDKFKEGIKERIEQPQYGVSSKFGGSTVGGNPYRPNSSTGNTSRSKNSVLYGIGTGGTQNRPYSSDGIVNPGYDPQLALPKTRKYNPYKKQDKITDENVPAPFQNLPNLDNGGASNHFSDSPGFTTSQGAPIKFSGPDVYTVNGKGQVVAMPDGTYFLNDGRSILVDEGKNILPPDANNFGRGS